MYAIRSYYVMKAMKPILFLGNFKTKIVPFSIFKRSEQQHLKLTNMKLLRNFSIIFIVASFLASCDEGITGSGPVVTDTYSIPYFTSIECNTPGRINLLQGSNQSLSLTTNDNLFRYFVV